MDVDNNSCPLYPFWRNSILLGSIFFIGACKKHKVDVEQEVWFCFSLVNELFEMMSKNGTDRRY